LSAYINVFLKIFVVFNKESISKLQLCVDCQLKIFPFKFKIPCKDEEDNIAQSIKKKEEAPKEKKKKQEEESEKEEESEERKIIDKETGIFKVYFQIKKTKKKR